MNPYIGDRQLDPDEQDECPRCDGFKTIAVLCEDIDTWHQAPCPDCAVQEADND